MSSDAFRIRPAWPDFMLYEEDDARQIQFSRRSMHEPPQVLIPRPDHWRDKMPAWAHERRTAIVGRLQAAGCVLVEAGADSIVFVSPDGSIGVEEQLIQDDRAGPWGMLRVVALPERKVLVQLPGYAAGDVLRFPRAGVLVLGMTGREKQQWQVQIDVTLSTFSLHPQEAERPLALLLAELESFYARRSQGPAAPSPLRTRLSTLLQVSGSLLLVAGGVWMALSAENHKDFWIGIFSVLFFGACASLPLLERKGRAE